eukprot:COSAG02_NODE_603_length_19693_cov_3.883944_3_plen_157_part_00
MRSELTEFAMTTAVHDKYGITVMGQSRPTGEHFPQSVQESVESRITNSHYKVEHLRDMYTGLEVGTCLENAPHPSADTRSVRDPRPPAHREECAPAVIGRSQFRHPRASPATVTRQSKRYCGFRVIAEAGAQGFCGRAGVRGASCGSRVRIVEALW